MKAAQVLDNGLWGYKWALESRSCLDEGCQEQFTHFLGNWHERPIGGKSKLSDLNKLSCADLVKTVPSLYATSKSFELFYQVGTSGVAFKP